MRLILITAALLLGTALGQHPDLAPVAAPALFAQEPDPMHVPNTRTAVLGARRDLDLSPPTEAALAAANEAVRFFNAAGSLPHRLDFSEIVSGTRQVVAGVKYEMQLRAMDMDCPPSSVEQCAGLGTNTLLEVKVWSRPWMAETPWLTQVIAFRAE